MNYLFYLVPAAAVIALVFAYIFFRQMMKESEGTATMKEIAKLTSAVQANAIAHSVIPGGMPHQPTAEDMLAEIIKPTYKERS